MLAISLLASACAYRLSSPAPLAEPLAIVVERNDSHLPATQLGLVQELSRSIRDDLGWRLHPGGPARLQLLLLAEEVEATASSDLGVASRWEVALRGTWRLETSDHPPLSGQFRGIGHVSTLATEASELQEAIEDASEDLVTQLLDRTLAWEATAAAEEEGP